jgi:hypothetical protein
VKKALSLPIVQKSDAVSQFKFFKGMTGMEVGGVKRRVWKPSVYHEFELARVQVRSECRMPSLGDYYQWAQWTIMIRRAGARHW